MGNCKSKNAKEAVIHTPAVNGKPERRSIGASSHVRTGNTSNKQRNDGVNQENGNPNSNSNNNSNNSESDDVISAKSSRGDPSETSKSLASSLSRQRDNGHIPGYSSGASTPPVMDADNSTHSTSGSQHNSKCLSHSSSVLGLDTIINDRRAEGDLKSNVVHMEVPFGKPIEEVYDGIHDGPVLGSGVSGLVRLCAHKATGAKYAVKCLDLGLVETDEGLQQLREEIAIMCQLDHPNIVRLEEVYESHSEIYLVQELCVGGELFDRLDEQPDYHYTEAQCAKLVKQMLCSVRYIHSKGIIHRDLKLENFLFSTADPDSELKMIDFGLSKHFKYGEVHHEAVGTPYTVAPEVIRGSYEERCDVWAIGVITYLLLSGDPPFGGCGGPESLMQVRSNILAGRFRFEPTYIWENISQEAKDFIRMLLVTDPTNRPTARQCQKSSWLHDWANREKKVGDSRLNTEVINALVNFKEYSDMRKLLCEVLSFTLLPDQITDLRKEFEKLDIEGSGEISLKGLKQVLMQGAGSGSLGALTEEEVEDIFNAMRVRKTETRIHWHEFIAAGLSQCKVDERNLRLAFERLDADHKGFVTFENIMDMMGKDGAESETEMRAMWANSMKACKCQGAHVTYEDFLLLMKGQTVTSKEFTQTHYIQQQQANPAPIVTAPSSFIPIPGGELDVLHELSDDTDDDTEPHLSPVDRRAAFVPVLSLPSVIERNFDVDDGPISIDADDDEDLDKLADQKFKMNNLTPPQTPVRSPIDFVTPTERYSNNSPSSLSLSGPLPSLPNTMIDFSRRRSKSVDEAEQYQLTIPENELLRDSRRVMFLPEHTHNTKDIEASIKDDKLTALVVNRKLYRAHRQMRLAVLEASKRFEDQQFQKTKAELQAKSEAETSRLFGAGLVMRHGHKKELSTDAIRLLMQENQKAHQSMVETAARRGGRGRRARKKTVSDMSGMLLSIPSEETASTNSKPPLVTQSVKLRDPPQEIEHGLKLHDMTKPEPTVPGKFRKTYDPFHQMGVSLRETETMQSSIKVSASDGELNNTMPPASPDST